MNIAAINDKEAYDRYVDRTKQYIAMLGLREFEESINDNSVHGTFRFETVSDGKILEPMIDIRTGYIEELTVHDSMRIALHSEVCVNHLHIDCGGLYYLYARNSDVRNLHIDDKLPDLVFYNFMALPLVHSVHYTLSKLPSAIIMDMISKILTSSSILSMHWDLRKFTMFVDMELRMHNKHNKWKNKLLLHLDGSLSMALGHSVGYINIKDGQAIIGDDLKQPVESLPDGVVTAIAEYIEGYIKYIAMSEIHNNKITIIRDWEENAV